MEEQKLYTAHAEIDRENGLYHVGETVRCKVNFFDKDGKPYHGKVRAFARIESDVVLDEKTEYAGETLHFSVTCDRPAWVYFGFEILDENGAALTGPQVWKHFGKPTIVEDIGAMFDPEEIRTCDRAPADLVNFWENRIAGQRALPSNPVIRELPVPEKYQGKVRFYDVTLDIIDGKKATGYLAIPANAKPKSCMAYIWFLSWCWTDTLPEMALNQAANGALAFSATWHGFPLAQKDEFYQEKHKAFNSWEGIDDPEKWIMGYVYMRVFRELDFLKSLPEWNGKDLVVHGGSLAGAQSVAAAAFDKDVKLAVVAVPGFCEFNTGKFRDPGTPLHDHKDRITPEIVSALQYYSLANLTPLMQCETSFCTGFVDTLCTPSNVYAAYNALPESVKKSIYTNPRTGHYGTTPDVEGDERLTAYFKNNNVQKYEK